MGSEVGRERRKKTGGRRRRRERKKTGGRRRRGRKKSAVSAVNRERWMAQRIVRLRSRGRFCQFRACPFGYHVWYEQNLIFGNRIIYRT